MRSSSRMALISSMLGVGLANPAGGADVMQIRLRSAEPESMPIYGRSANKDRNSGGNRISQKKRRIRARQAGF